MIRLAPSQQLALLTATASGGDAAVALLAGEPGREALRALSAGPPRQVGALFAWYAATIARDGVGAIIGTDRTLGLAVRAARHPSVFPVVQHAFRGQVDFPSIRDLATRVSRECTAMREEGEAILDTLTAPATDLGIALFGEEAA